MLGLHPTEELTASMQSRSGGGTQHQGVEPPALEHNQVVEDLKVNIGWEHV